MSEIGKKSILTLHTGGVIIKRQNGARRATTNLCGLLMTPAMSIQRGSASSCTRSRSPIVTTLPKPGGIFRNIGETVSSIPWRNWSAGRICTCFCSGTAFLTAAIRPRCWERSPIFPPTAKDCAADFRKFTGRKSVFPTARWAAGCLRKALKI